MHQHPDAPLFIALIELLFMHESRDILGSFWGRSLYLDICDVKNFFHAAAAASLDHASIEMV